MPRNLSWLILFLAGCAGADASFEERRLAVIRDDARVIVPVSFSQDGRHAAYVEQRGDGCRVVTGSQTSKPYGALC
jgi:hypothetical protein